LHVKKSHFLSFDDRTLQAPRVAEKASQRTPGRVGLGARKSQFFRHAPRNFVIRVGEFQER
jgi:hypothetical protein